MLVGVDQIARFHLHPKKLHRAVEVLQMRVSMRDLDAGCEKVESGTFHFVNVADCAVGDDTWAAECPVHGGSAITPIRTSRRRTQLLYNADAPRIEGSDILPIAP